MSLTLRYDRDTHHILTRMQLNMSGRFYRGGKPEVMQFCIP